MRRLLLGVTQRFSNRAQVPALIKEATDQAAPELMKPKPSNAQPVAPFTKDDRDQLREQAAAGLAGWAFPSDIDASTRRQLGRVHTIPNLC